MTLAVVAVVTLVVAIIMVYHAVVSKSKDKGTAAERWSVNALHRLGFPDAERRAQSGANDKGDIGGIRRLCWEVKDAKKWCVPEWMRETETERVNADADFGILIVKIPGIGHKNAHRWLTVMDGDAMTKLIRAAIRNHSDQSKPIPRYWYVELPAVSAEEGLERLVREERLHPGMPAMVSTRKRKSKLETGDGFYSLMRLDARCSFLRAAGYGEREIMG